MRARARRLAPSGESATALASAERQDAIVALNRQRRARHLGGYRLDLSIPTASVCAIPPSPSPSSIFTLPAWSDLAGWDDRSSYGTIQLADTDGDGAREVVGRSPQGIEISRFDAATGVFGRQPAGPPLSDAAGWSPDHLALTVRSGDIDGDGRAEMVALNSAGKVVTYTSDAKGVWTELPATSTPSWDDKGTDWTDQTHYETFRLVDLDGDGTDELVARAARGIIVARFTPGAGEGGAGAWTALAPGPALSDADGWNHARYSSTLRYGDVDGRPGVELVALDASPSFIVFSYDPATDSWSRLGDGMPAWPQGKTNWADAPYYSTPRLANLDGDTGGVKELLARSKDGLVAARWDSATAAWASMPTSPVLADAGGWDQAQYYETIRVGDVDGDGADEVFVRAATTLQLLQYDATSTTQPWTVQRSAPLVASAWSDDDNYRTFRLGDVDGDGAEEVLGRDQYGVRTFRYDDGALVSAVTPYPSYSGPDCTAYNAIVRANVDHLEGDDLRAAYGDGRVELDKLSVPSSRPAGVTAAAWKKVAPQIRKELSAAQSVRQWHVGPNGMVTVIEQSYTPQVGSIGNISEYFRVKPSDSVASEILPWLEGVVTAVGVAVEPEGAFAAEAIAAGINSGLSFTAQTLSNKGQTTFELNQTESQLQGYVSQMQQEATNANTANESLVPREYGLMLAMQDVPLPGGSAPWQENWRQADIYFWQTFTKTFWNTSFCDGQVRTGLLESVGCKELATEKVSALYAQPFDPWVRNSQEAYWVGRGKSSHKAPTNFRKAPSSTLAAGHKVLFDTPSAQCTPPLSAKTAYTNTCRLGIPEEDFYLARNGWDLPFHQVTHIP